MNKVYILDGTDHAIAGLGEACHQYFVGKGWEADRLVLRESRVSQCLACDGCAERTIGECVLKDDGSSIARSSVHCSLFVVMTRVVFGGYSSQLKGGFERTLPNILPFFTIYKGELHHKLRYQHRPPMLFVGYLDGPDSRQEHIFHRLALRSGTNFMVPSASCVCTGTRAAEELKQQLPRMLEEVKL